MLAAVLVTAWSAVERIKERIISRIVTLTMSPALDLFGATEHLYEDAKSRFHQHATSAGGGGINVARNLHRLGLDVLAIFPAGGPNGQRLEETLTSAGVPCRVIPVASNTRQNFALTEKATGKFYHLVFPGPGLLEPEWQACLEAVENLDPVPEFLVLSGSLPPGTPDDFYQRIARSARKRHIRVVLDTSSRALRPTLEAGVFIAKLNKKELLELGYAGPDAPSSQLAAMGDMVLAGYAEHLIVTMGGTGALLASKSGLRMAAKPPLVDIVCHVGAGDAFVSAVVYRLCLGHTINDAFRWGIAAAAASISKPGSDLADIDEVERLTKEVVDLPG